MEIIDSFSKLTLGKYEEILAIANDDALEDIDKTIGILSVLTGATEDEISHLPIAEFTMLSAKSKFLQATDFKAGRMARKYKIADWELIPVSDYRKLETAQYIDFKTYASEMEGHMVELISVILVPKGHRYNEGYDIIELQKAIRENMSVTDGATIVGFFFVWSQRLMADSLRYCRREAERIKDREKREKVLKMVEEQEMRLGTSGDG